MGNCYKHCSHGPSSVNEDRKPQIPETNQLQPEIEVWLNQCPSTSPIHLRFSRSDFSENTGLLHNFTKSNPNPPRNSELPTTVISYDV